MNNLDKQYKELLDHILHFGVEKKDRTGTGTKSIFGYQIRHNMKEGFPLLTTKKMHWKSIVAELLWFLRGDTNIKYLVDNDCHIWDGDAWANYKRKTLEKFMGDTTIAGYAITNKEEFINKIKTDDEFAKKWGELGPIYGKQWRSWKNFVPYNVTESGCQVMTEVTDQIANLINELKTNPDSRRLMVSAWNVGELDQMVLPPCHYGFQVYTRELSLEERMELSPNIVTSITEDDLNKYIEDSGKSYNMTKMLNDKNIPQRAISLMWNQRSVDTFLGLPFNIASYGLLLEMIADEVNMIPEELIGNLGDTHLYLNHIEQAKEQNTRTPFKLPTVHVRDGIESFMPDDIILENYQSHPAIKAPLSN